MMSDGARREAMTDEQKTTAPSSGGQVVESPCIEFDAGCAVVVGIAEQGKTTRCHDIVTDIKAPATMPMVLGLGDVSEGLPINRVEACHRNAGVVGKSTIQLGCAVDDGKLASPEVGVTEGIFGRLTADGTARAAERAWVEADRSVDGSDSHSDQAEVLIGRQLQGCNARFELLAGGRDHGGSRSLTCKSDGAEQSAGDRRVLHLFNDDSGAAVADGQGPGRRVCSELGLKTEGDKHMRNDSFARLDEFLARLFGPGIEPSAEKCVSDAAIEELCDRLGSRIATLGEGRQDVGDVVTAIESNAKPCEATAADGALPQTI